MRKMKKILSAFTALITVVGLSGCSEKDFEEISDFITVNTGIQSNNILNKNAAEQYQTAIINGNIEWMKEIVAANPDLDVNYTNEMTAMYCACWESDEPDYYKAKMIEALLEVGVDPDIGDPLQLTTYNKNYYFTKALLKSDIITLDTTDSLGNTPLSLAIENHKGGCSIERYEQAVLMLEAGATPYAGLFQDRYEEDDKSSHFECVTDSPVSAKLLMNMLLESGQPSGLKPALEYAFSGQMDKCLEELKSNNVESEYNKHEKYVIYKYFAYYGTPEQYEEVKELLNYDVGDLMLSLPCQTGNLEMAKHFLVTYPDVFVINGANADNIALRGFKYAICWGYADICKLFCDNNVSIEKTAYGYAELRPAILSEDLETVKVIYDYLKSKYGLNELEIGQAYMNYSYRDVEKAKEIADFFFSEGYDLSFMEFGFIEKDFAEYLYNKGRPLNPTDLTYAVKSEDPEFVKLVLEKGADPNQSACEHYFSKQWNISASGESLTYEEFVEKGDDCYEAIIFTAVEQSNSDVVKMLVDYGADVNAVIVDGDAWSDGLTPIQMAIYSSKAITKVLLESGADTSLKYTPTREGITINAFKKENLTLAEYYEYYGREDLVELLKEYK